MRFRFQHSLPTDRVGLERAFLEPAFGSFLVVHHPGLRRAENRVDADDGRVVSGVLTLEAEPRAYKVAGRAVWTRQGVLCCHWRYDRERGEGRFENHPNIPATLKALFVNHGTMRVEESEPGAVLRVFELEILVRLPVVGRLAERAVFRGGLEMMDQEARLLARFLVEQDPDAGQGP